MSLHKHLNVDSIQYLSCLIAKLDLSQHNEQTLLLSALLTKNLWILIIDWEDEQENNSSGENAVQSESISTEKSTKLYKGKFSKSNENNEYGRKNKPKKLKSNSENPIYSNTSSSGNESQRIEEKVRQKSKYFF